MMTNNVFDYASSAPGDFDEAMSTYGWVVYQDAITDDLVEQINDNLPHAYAQRRDIQLRNGIAANMDGTLHHLVEAGLFTLDFLEHQIAHLQISKFLGGRYILNSLGAVINMKDASPYVQNVHRDIRTFTGDFKLMIQMIAVLDDFTEDNGATYFLSGSHLSAQQPSDAEFYLRAHRAVASRGSVILFDANLWHAAGKNYTDQARRALTMAFTRPFMKQQLDYPRALGYDFGAQLTEELRQVIGYNARVPADLEEYYQPVHKRMYQRDQG